MFLIIKPQRRREEGGRKNEEVRFKMKKPQSAWGRFRKEDSPPGAVSEKARSKETEWLLCLNQEGVSLIAPPS